MSSDRVRVKGVNWVRDRVWASGEHVILFERHPLPPPKKRSEKNPVTKN